MHGSTIEKYLEDLEERLDAKVEDDLVDQWQAFCDGAFSGDIFTPRRQKARPSDLKWPGFHVNDTLEDRNKMLLNQLSACSRTVAEGNGGILSVRANYGSGILSSVFGAEIFVMDRESPSLPTTRPLAGGKDQIRELIGGGIPDLRAGYGERTLAMGEYYREVFSRYPKIERYVMIYHPDLQGAMDLCELLWGSALFLDVLDEPDLVKQFLVLIVDTYMDFMHEWNAIVPPLEGYAAHWSMLHRGMIMLRSDSAMNFSPAMFQEFIEPFEQRLLDEFGGGALHFCGRGDHYIDRVALMDRVYAVNLSQPELNDMETIFRNTVDHGIKLIGLRREAAEQALRAGRDLQGCVHCP